MMTDVPFLDMFWVEYVGTDGRNDMCKIKAPDLGTALEYFKRDVNHTLIRGIAQEINPNVEKTFLEGKKEGFREAERVILGVVTQKIGDLLERLEKRG